MHFQIAYILMPPWVSSVLHEMDFFYLVETELSAREGGKL